MADLDPVVASILLVWLIFFGACVGSFLNVVVYRLPLGKSLSDPPSHCPKCGHPIRWFDNVPVLGWIWLRGRCRDCRAPISVRYPIVEFVGGAVFGSIAWLTLQRGGDASLAEFFFFVLGLSSLVLTLFAAGLIERDGQKVPWRLFLPVIVLGPMMPWLVQEGLHIPWYFHAKVKGVMPLAPPWIAAAVFSVGVLSLISFINITPKGILTGRHFTILLAALLVGLYVGTNGMGIVVTASVLAVLVRWTSWYRSLDFFLILAGATFVGILLILFYTPASAPLG